MVGRLLEEISWERATNYREVGRGLENVLSAEVLQALNFLPRKHFLGALMQAAHGAEKTRTLLVSEIEEAAMEFLPGDLPLSLGNTTFRQVHVQPDALLTLPGAYVLVEAKRLRRSAFQLNQLAREYVAVMAHAQGRLPLIVLFGVMPPVSIKGLGKMSVKEAVAGELALALAESGSDPLAAEDLMETIDEVFCWISWAEIDAVIRKQSATFAASDASVHGSVQRLAASITTAIAWHS